MSGKGQLPAIRDGRQEVSTASGVYGEGRSEDRDLDVGVRDILGILGRRRWSISIGFLLAFVTVVAGSIVWPKTFQSSALMMIEPEENTAEAEFLRGLVQTSQLETEIELMRSRRVMEAAVDSLDLHVAVSPVESRGDRENVLGSLRAGPDAVPGLFVIDVEEGRTVVREGETDSLVLATDQLPRPGVSLAFAGIEATLTEVPEGGVAVSVAPFARAVTSTRGRVSASRAQRDANLVQLRCEGGTPQSAYELCQEVLDNYIGMRTGIQRVGAAATADFLRTQVNALSEQLTQAENRLEAYKEQNQIVDLDERAAAEVRGYVGAKEERDRLDAERSALEQVVRAAAQSGDPEAFRNLASFPSFIANDAVTQLVMTLITLETDRNALALRRSEENADVVALDLRIAEVERQLFGFAESYLSALSLQIESLDRNLVESGTRLALIPGQQVTATRLQREVSQLQGLHNTLQLRLREAMVAEGVSLPSVRVVDPASMPVDPSAPNMKMNFVLGMMFSVAFGLGLGLLKELLDTTVHRREEVESRTGLPVLVQVPGLRLGKVVLPVEELRTRVASGVGSVTSHGAIPATDLGTSPFRSAYLVSVPRYSTWGGGGWSSKVGQMQASLDSFTNLAMDLRAAARYWEGDGAVIAVMSPGRQEGKTFTCCNLGLVLAAEGAETLVIDGDLRARGVSRFFGLGPESPGLTDVLSVRGGSNGIPSVRLGQDSGDLWVLPAGRSTPGAGALLGTDRFDRFLAAARAQFGFTLIDTPPITLASDAGTVAAAADAVLLVVRENRTDRDGLELAMARLRRAGANVIGVVMNDVKEWESYYGGFQHSSQANGGGATT